MRKKKVIIFVVIIAIIIYGVYWSFYDMSRLPKGNLISEVQSPDGNYSIRVYVSESSLSAPAVRGELNYKNSKKKSKNIYWNYKEDTVNMEWIDNFTIIINGHELDIRHDTFDFRRNNKD